MAIPRVFHFIFGLREQLEPFHLLHFLCLRSCIEVNRPQTIKFHYQHEPWGPLWDQIRPHLQLCRLEGHLPLSDYRYPKGSASADFQYAHSSDFLRVEILLREGGVYADMDTLFVRPFPDTLFEQPFVMGHETVDPHVTYLHGGGSLCNALILAEPGAKFAAAWYEGMEAAFDGNWSRHSTFLPFELSRLHPSWIHVEPTTSFFHLDWTAEGIRDLYESSVELPDSVYSLHLWAHLWSSERRTDVSRFHEGRLTPQYVAHANTTYANYARRFLPESIDRGSATGWKLSEAGARLEGALASMKNMGTRAVRKMLRS
jgi:hypothetical protein